MKNIFKSLLLLFVLAGTLWSCEKDENKIYYEGGTAPSLTADISVLTLTSGNATEQAAVFTWTNPNYQFTTGISSQDVNYILQVDTTGANFTSPGLQEISTARSLGVTYTVKELNGILTKLSLTENIPHNVEFRIKATLVNNSVPLYSNVIQAVITPYLDVAVPVPPTGELYITGNGTPSDWTNNPPESQHCTKVSNTEYNIVMNFNPGLFYKFLSNLNQWQPQYGGSSATGGDLGYNFGLPGQKDPDAIPTPAVAGSYKVTLNFKTGKYTVVKQ
ncbi:MAG: SusE domain-containing protein [Panacibacter sp.]